MRKRYICIVLLLLVFPGTGWAQGQKFHVEIPYEEVRHQVIIHAVVEGIEGRYIIDTGAPSCITRTRSLKSPGKEIFKQAIVDAHGQEGYMRQTSMESFIVGGINFAKLPVLVMDEGHLIEVFDVDGIIGNNILSFVVVRIDSKRKVVILTDNAEQFNINPRASIKMVPNHQKQVFLDINLGNGASEQIMFDTGSGAFYELNEPSRDALKDCSSMETLGTGFGASGVGAIGEEQAGKKYRVKIGDFRIGIGKFTNVVTETMIGPCSRIGARLLDYGIVTIDYPNGYFYFEPFEGGSVDMYRKNWNVDITFSGGQLVAGCVWDSAREEGLEGGERVVSINGARVGEIDPKTALSGSFMKLEGDEATLVVIGKDGKEKKVMMRKE